MLAAAATGCKLRPTVSANCPVACEGWMDFRVGGERARGAQAFRRTCFSIISEPIDYVVKTPTDIFARQKATVRARIRPARPIYGREALLRKIE